MRIYTVRRIQIILAILATTFFCANAAEAKSLDTNTFVDIIKSAKPGVVHISGIQKYFDTYKQSTELRQVVGSGFLVAHGGETKVLTNKHVVKDTITLEIKIQTGRGERKTEGEIETLNSYTDLALVKLKNTSQEFLTGLHTLPLADSNAVREGEWILAIGNPYGLSFTSQVGTVSAVGRSAVVGRDIPPHDFIQINADVNPGNSGGPLINLDSAVIGVVTAIVSRSGGSVGIGFAIPINIARDFLEKRSLDNSSTSSAGWIGITAQAAEEGLLQLFKHPKNAQGLLITAISRPSPADTAGLKQGDLLISITTDGKIETILRPSDFERIISRTSPGSKLTVKILRNGKERDVSLIVAPRPESK